MLWFKHTFNILELLGVSYIVKWGEKTYSYRQQDTATVHKTHWTMEYICAIFTRNGLLDTSLASAKLDYTGHLTCQWTITFLDNFLV